MKKFFLLLSAALLAAVCFNSCFPDDYLDDRKEVVTPTPKPDTDKDDESEKEPEKEPETDNESGFENTLTYDDLDKYDALKNYVNRAKSPDFKLGTGVTVSNFLRKTDEYKTVTENFNEMTAGNAMKQASILRNNGTMDFTQVKNFLDAAEQAGMTVYGHTLAWHAQQTNAYLNGLIKGKRVEVPDGTGNVVLLQTNFNDGSSPLGGWGNNHTRTVVNGVLKITNPSSVNNWEAQMAYDFSDAFVLGQKYTLSFKIKGSAAGHMDAGFQITDGYKSAGEFPRVDFDTQWQEVNMECECTAEGGTRLIFSYGEFAGDIYIDDFVFTATGVNYAYEDLTAEEKKQVLSDAMERWIKGVMEVTATRVSAWDAVNESVSGRDNNGDGFYELESAAWGSSSNFYWQDYLGSEDYVRIVIANARKYYAEYGGTAPLKLFINDYNLESDWDDNRKVKSLINWIKIWESDGVTKIDGIGTQMHVSYYENEATQKSKENHYVKMLQLMANTGKLVKISELDMGYVDKNGNTVGTANITDAQLRKMADYYDFIVTKYFEIVPPAQQYGITQWCLTDAPGALGTGWRGGEPVGLFYENYKRKYAYAGYANGMMRSW